MSSSSATPTNSTTSSGGGQLSFTYKDPASDSHKLTPTDKEVVVTFDPKDQLAVLGKLVDEVDKNDGKEKGFYIDPNNKCAKNSLAIGTAFLSGGDRGFALFGIHPSKKSKAFQVLDDLSSLGLINYLPAILDNHPKKGGTRYYLPKYGLLQLIPELDDIDALAFFNSQDLNSEKKYPYTKNLYVVRLPQTEGPREDERLFQFLTHIKDGLSQEDKAKVLYYDGYRVDFHQGLSWPGNSNVDPTDPSYSSQWGLEETVYDKDAQIDTAWTKTIGLRTVYMAFLDTGLDVAHSDLSTFTDGTGRIFDEWNVVPVTPNSTVTDSDGHGTNVCAVAAATANNNLGIAGVAPNCKITPVKIFSTVNTTAYADMVEGINYVKTLANNNSGRRYIMNLSWKQSAWDQGVEDAILAAYNTNRIVIVCAAWDDDLNLNSNNIYPASYCFDATQHVIAVGAHVKSGGKKSPSNYSNSNANGGKVIFAPGDAIHTYDPGNTTPVTRSGSSFAAAFVTGVAALVWSYHKDQSGAWGNQTYVYDRIMTHLFNTGISFGKGRIDGFKATDYITYP